MCNLDHEGYCKQAFFLNKLYYDAKKSIGCPSDMCGYFSHTSGQMEIIRILDIMLKEVMNNITYACFSKNILRE